MRKALGVLLAIILLVFATVSQATEYGAPERRVALSSAALPVPFVKDETVYVNLNDDGSISRVSIINRIQTPVDGIYADYGSYSEIKGLTSEIQPRLEGGKVIWNLPASDKGFYYEGIPSGGEIPCNFTISYALNGRPCKAKDLIGKTGKIRIDIKAAPNPKAAQFYLDHYAAQIQVPLTLDKCGNIVAEGAQSVIVGSTNTLAFIVMPGASKEMSVAFDAGSFEMDPINITLAPMDVSSLTGLDSEAFPRDAGRISKGAEELVKGTEQLRDGFLKISDGLIKLVAGLLDTAKGHEEFTKGLEAYIGGINQVSGNIGRLSAGLSELDKNGAQLEAGYHQLSGNAVQLIDGLMDGLPPERQAAYAQQVEMIKQGFLGFEQNLNAYAQGIAESSQGLSAVSEGMAALSQKGNELSAGAAQIKNGLAGISHGFETLYGNFRKIPDEIQKLIDGEKEFQKGINDAIEMLEGLNIKGGDISKPVSFADPSQKVRSVQFVIRTPELIGERLSSPPPITRSEKSLWEKLVALFTG